MHDDELGDDAEDTAAITEDQLIARIDAEKRIARLLEAQSAALRGLSDREREVLRKRFEKDPAGER
jgi:DNA-directed RNA polymerase sigma subunit (sigma70/sigma32)